MSFFEPPHRRQIYASQAPKAEKPKGGKEDAISSFAAAAASSTKRGGAAEQHTSAGPVGRATTWDKIALHEQRKARSAQTDRQKVAHPPSPSTIHSEQSLTSKLGVFGLQINGAFRSTSVLPSTQPHQSGSYFAPSTFAAPAATPTSHVSLATDFAHAFLCPEPSQQLVDINTGDVFDESSDEENRSDDEDALRPFKKRESTHVSHDPASATVGDGVEPYHGHHRHHHQESVSKQKSAWQKAFPHFDTPDDEELIDMAERVQTANSVDPTLFLVAHEATQLQDKKGRSHGAHERKSFDDLIALSASDTGPVSITRENVDNALQTPHVVARIEQIVGKEPAALLLDVLPMQEQKARRLHLCASFEEEDAVDEASSPLTPRPQKLMRFWPPLYPMYQPDGAIVYLLTTFQFI